MLQRWSAKKKRKESNDELKKDFHKKLYSKNSTREGTKFRFDSFKNRKQVGFAGGKKKLNKKLF